MPNGGEYERLRALIAGGDSPYERLRAAVDNSTPGGDDSFLGQAGVGVAESFGRAGRGLARVAGALTGSERVKDYADFLDDYYTDFSEEHAPTSGAGTAGRVLGNIAGEGLQYIGGGGAGRALGGAVLRRIAPRAAAQIAGQTGARAQVLKDALAVAPVDVAITASGPENSVAGAVAELTDSDLARRIAENPITRFGSEALTGIVGDVGIRSLGAGLGALRRGAADLAPDQLNRPVFEAAKDLIRGGREVVGEAVPEALNRQVRLLPAGAMVTPPPPRALTDEEAAAFARREADRLRAERADQPEPEFVIEDAPPGPARQPRTPEELQERVQPGGPIEGIEDVGKSSDRLRLERELSQPLELEGLGARAGVGAAALGATALADEEDRPGLLAASVFAGVPVRRGFTTVKSVLKEATRVGARTLDEVLEVAASSPRVKTRTLLRGYATERFGVKNLDEMGLKQLDEDGLARWIREQEAAGEAPGSVALPEGAPRGEWIKASRETLLGHALRGWQTGGKEWYREATEQLPRALGLEEGEVPKFFDFLAAFSPNTGPALNLEEALQNWARFKRGEPLRGAMGTKRDVAQRVLEGGQAGSPKVWSFGKNLAGDSEHVTVDLWIDRALRDLAPQPDAKALRGNSITGLKYSQAREEVRRLARELTEFTGEQWTPAEAQAALWVGYRDNWLETLGRQAQGNDSFQSLLAGVMGRIDPEAVGPALPFRPAEGSVALAETMPSRTSPRVPGIQDAPLRLREEYSTRRWNIIAKPLRDLAKILGLGADVVPKPHRGVGGAFEGRANINFRTVLPEGEPIWKAKALAAAKGYLGDQDSAPVKAYRHNARETLEATADVGGEDLKALVDGEQLRGRFHAITFVTNRHLKPAQRDALAEALEPHGIGFDQIGDEIQFADFSPAWLDPSEWKSARQFADELAAALDKTDFWKHAERNSGWGHRVDSELYPSDTHKWGPDGGTEWERVFAEALDEGQLRDPEAAVALLRDYRRGIRGKLGTVDRSVAGKLERIRTPPPGDGGGVTLGARGAPAVLGGVAGGALPGTPEERAQRAGLGFAIGLGGEAAVLRGRARVRSRDNAILAGSPAAQRVARSVGTGSSLKAAATGSMRERLGSALRWARYKLSRLEQPLETFGSKAGGSNKLRNMMARARGAVSAAHQHMEENLRPLLRLVEEAPRSVNALAKAERALELVRLGKQATPKQVADWQATVAQLGSDPTVRQGVDALRAYYRDLLDRKLDAGVLSQDQYNAIVARGDNYVPFVPDDLVEWTGTGWKYSPVRSTGVRRSRGDRVADAATVDPLDQAVLDTYETFSRVGKQRVANVIGEIADADPQAAAPFLERVTPARKPGGAPVVEPDVVETIVNGERQFFRVTDRDLYDAWTNFNKPLQSGVLRVFAKMRQFMQSTITGHPAFAVANGIRDFFMSGLSYPLRGGARGVVGGAGTGAAIGALASEDRGRGALRGAAIGGSIIGARHFAAHAARSLDALNDILGPKTLGGVAGGVGAWIGQDDEKSLPEFLGTVGLAVAIGMGAGGGVAKIRPGNKAIYDEFLREGAGGMGFYARNKRSARALRRALLRDGVDASDIINPRSWWDAIQYVSRAVETAPRLARYKELRAAGQDVGEAVFQARDLSLDFSVKPGSRALRTVTDVAPFLNPAIQGIDKTARLLANPNAQAVAGATILAPSVALWLMIQGDPETAREYTDRPQYERNSYWLIPKKWFTEEDGFYRVPKPFELGFLYASLPERTLEYLGSKDPEAFSHALRDMYNQFTPEGWPVVIGPLIEANIGEHGYDFWRRREINPRAWETLPPEFQFDERTSTLGVQAGRLLGKSPAKIDHIIRGVTGSIGSEALQLTSELARRLGIDTRSSPMGTTRTFARRFHTEPTSTTETELAFRRRWDEAQRHYNAVKDLFENDKEAEAREYMQEHRDDLLAYFEMVETEKAVRALSRARGKIRESPAPRERRLEGVRRINRAMSDMVAPTLREQVAARNRAAVEAGR